MDQTNIWLWDKQSQKYYRILGQNADGTYQYEWEGKTSTASNLDTQHGAQGLTAQQDGEATIAARGRADSHAPDPNMIPAAPDHVRNNLYFTGTPERGWYETLDSRYRVRTRGEAHQFFQKGRVLAMLWAETMSETATRNFRNGTENTAITVGRFGQNVYSQIRRFVVVKVNRREHFVYACAITTYGERGVTKPGCNAQDHSIVYMKGQQPTQYEGEAERGLIKDPIMIEPSDPSERMHAGSRLRYSKVYPIEWNVKFRDIGMISKSDRAKVLKYHKESQDSGFDSDTDEEIQHTQSPPPASQSYQQHISHQSHQTHHHRNSYGHSHAPSQYSSHSTLHPEQYRPGPAQHQHPQPQYQRYHIGYNTYQ